MKTFRPAGTGGGGTTSLQSPLSSGALRTPRDAAAALDQSRRDSGVLFEQDEAEAVNTRSYGAGGGGGGAGQEGECLERDDDEHDSYHESIVVPKFNFQSLSLVNKSGLNQSSGLSHSRSSGLSGGGRGRTRKSRSSMDSLEFEHLDQLLESMNIQNDSLHHHHQQPS